MRIEDCKHWINKLTTTSHGRTRLAGYNTDELDKLPVWVIEMLLDYISAAYHAGCTDTREHMSSLRPKNMYGQIDALHAVQSLVNGARFHDENERLKVWSQVDAAITKGRTK